jgi:tetratricopeptide (TPR) repeat protein
MLTAGVESDETPQKRIKRILKLHRAGLSAQEIANRLDCELSQVKPVVMGNDEALTSELTKLLEQAKGLRCAYSRRLAYQPLRGPEGKIFEKRVLEEWMLTNDTWPNSSTPIRAPLAEVDRDVKEQVKQFSLRALEVVQNGIKINAQREHALVLAAECLSVLNASSNLNEFLGVLLDCSRDGQEAILRNINKFRPSLLRKLLLKVAPMRYQCGLTLVLTEVLEEAQLNSKKVKAMTFISTLKRNWISTNGLLSALMNVVLGRLYAKINEGDQAEHCLYEANSAQQPAETELSEFYGGLGDLHFDLESYELAKVRYEEAINKSRDPQSLKRFRLKLKHIKENEARKARLREKAMHSEQARFKEQARECRALGEGQLADLKSLNIKQDVLKDELQEAQRSREKVKPKASMYCSRMLLVAWSSTKTEDDQEIALEPAAEQLNDAQSEKQRAREFRTKVEAELANLHEKAASILIQDDASKQLDLANIYFSLGVLYRSRDNTRAVEYYLKSLSIWQEVIRPNHSTIASIYNDLGVLYRSEGDYRNAEENYLKSLSKWQEVLPANHTTFASIYNDLGVLYRIDGDNRNAEKYYLKSLSIWQVVLPANHTTLASIYNDLGVLYRSEGDYRIAEEYYLKCLSIWQVVLPANHTTLASIYNDLGVLYRIEGDYRNAEEYYLKCLSIWQKVLPANHTTLASIYNDLGVLYRIEGDNRSSEEYYLKCLSIRQEVLPANHTTFASIYNDLGVLYRSEGDSTRAEEYFRLSKLTQS